VSKRKPNTPKESTGSEAPAASPVESTPPATETSVRETSVAETRVTDAPVSETPTPSTAGKNKPRTNRKPSGSPKAEVSGDADPASARRGRSTAKRSSAAAKASSQPENNQSVSGQSVSNRPASEVAAEDGTPAAESARPEETPAAARSAPKKRAAKTTGKEPTAQAKNTKKSATTEAQTVETPAAAPSTPEPAPAKPKNARGRGKSAKAKPEAAATPTAEVVTETAATESPAVVTAESVAPIAEEAPTVASPQSKEPAAPEDAPSAEGASATEDAPEDATENAVEGAPARSRNRRGRGGKRKAQSAQPAAESQNASAETRQPAAEQTQPVATEQPATQNSRPALPPLKPAGRRWYKVDLHMHTMASNDYEDPQVSWLDWLRTVAERGLEIVAIADHNTVRGVAAIRGEIEWLTKLEAVGRLTDQERADLEMWRELANRVLVLPGFEFTATFGFHILGIFPPETSVRTLEQLLLKLNVPPEKLDVGSTETGASADVLTAYRVIHEAGGLAIAAHANSTHGVALRDFPFGGQTKIAYTQDPNLDALEVTDLEGRGYSTARFFSGTKTEYPRKMHCIQGSDSHRINADPRNPKRLGIGDRATEMLLDDPSFAAILSVLRSTQFDRTRPARPKDKPFDAFAKAREEGNTLVQAFHETPQKPGAKLDAILNDICAFANSAGGSIFVGANAGKGRTAGVPRPRQVEDLIQNALGARLTPALDLRFDTVQSEGATILRIRVPKGEDRPYCLDDYKFYVRDEDETSLAVRDEIIALVLETMNQRAVEVAPGIDALAQTDITPETAASTDEPAPATNGARTRRGSKKNGSQRPPITDHRLPTTDPDDAFYLPQMGVEIVESETRNGMQYHTIRNLSKGETVRNISRRSAKDLWSYAIKQHETGAVKPGSIKWQGDVGLVHVEKRAGKLRYDLALRENGSTRVFYGVTEDGMEGRWAAFVQEEA